MSSSMSREHEKEDKKERLRIHHEKRQLKRQVKER